MYEAYRHHDIAVYAAYLDDSTKLLQSASGGVATALSEYILSQGGYVAGVAYSDDFRKAEYRIIHDSAELPRLKGSKYIDCDKKGIYSRIEKLLHDGETVLFFGLPCTVAALYKSLGSRPHNLITCELICHGPTYPKVHTDYIDALEAQHHSKIVDFSVRYKAGSWTPSCLYAKFENGDIFQKPFSQTEYGFAFFLLGKPGCYSCKFKGNNRQGDLMVGDFWGATAEDPFWNPFGVSCVFAETEKGHSLLKATPGMTLFPTTFERAVEENPLVIVPRKHKPQRDEFADLLEQHGLMGAAAHFQKQ